MERKGIVAFKGNPVTLLGPDLAIGDPAPDFTVLDNNLKPVRLSEFRGEIVIISVVPSLDTSVCELQTKRFNEEAGNLKAKVLTISMDLPFAQRRFCDSFKISNMSVLSDYRDREFGSAFGLHIKELGLLARSVFIIGSDGRIAYRQIVGEIGREPDYGEVIEAAKKLGA